MEKIKHEAGIPDAWICKCGNTPSSDGFYPSDPNGIEVEPVKGWSGLYVCARCGAIIDQTTLEIVGYGTQSHNREKIEPVSKP
jgi:hypothetical protein